MKSLNPKSETKPTTCRRTSPRPPANPRVRRNRANLRVALVGGRPHPRRARLAGRQAAGNHRAIKTASRAAAEGDPRRRNHRVGEAGTRNGSPVVVRARSNEDSIFMFKEYGVMFLVPIRMSLCMFSVHQSAGGVEQSPSWCASLCNAFATAIPHMLGGCVVNE